MTDLHKPDDDLLRALHESLGPRGFTTDPAEMEPWLTDWRGRVHGRAAALLSPTNVQEVAAIVRMAAAARVAIVPQGGNTSTVAGATPDGCGGALLLSLRRMRAIRSLSAEDNVIVAEAGCILSDVHAAALAQGLRFPLSLASEGTATIGGLVSTNAGGTQVLRFGTMRALLLGIEAVMPDGAIFDGLAALRKDNRGYDLRQLLCGAEGTLGVITAASLRLVPAIGARAVAWVGIDAPEDALRLLRRIEAMSGEAVESFELIPADGLDLVLHHIPGTRAPLERRHRWNVLIEATAHVGAPDPSSMLSNALAALMEADVVQDAVVAASESQANALWRLRETLPEAERADGVAAKHDIAVPVSAMPSFITDRTPEVEAAFPGARVLAFGHLGDGNIHFNVRPPPEAERGAWFTARGEAVNRLVHDMTVAVHGSISAEHGIGQTKIAEYARLADPVRLAMQRAIKDAIDPLGIMNPGKLLP